MSRKKAHLGRIFCCVGLATLFPSGCHRSKDPSRLASAVAVASDSGPGGDGAPPPGARAQDEKETSSGGLALLTARIRRLANAEYDASVKKLLSTSKNLASASGFPPDFRQEGFTVNDAQRVDAVIVERLASAADTLVAEARRSGVLLRLAPCDGATHDARRCAEAFVATFGPKVYRRPLTAEESASLLVLFDIGAEGASYEDGIDHVVRGLLQSAGFLYLTELGSGADRSAQPITLTPYEIASSVSYLVTSAPPDDILLAKAVAGALADPDEREAQVRRLLRQDPLAADNVVRLVREWLGIDQIATVSKDSLVYPEFPALKSEIVAESIDFVKAVIFRGTGTVSELLGADWTVNSGPLALYRTSDAGPLADTSRVTDRVGILNQAAFLARYANAHESHPVFRGVAVARRVACIHIDSPDSFNNIVVVPPVPDPAKTTRERFDIHAKDSICQLCHKTIDSFGFAFEQFDGMGAYRTEENGRPVDSHVAVDDKRDFDGPYADSNALATALSNSDSVRACFARFVFRAAAATNHYSLRSEEEFLDLWRTIPLAARGNVIDTLIAYVRLPTFTQRRAE
jgi:hypothetical protein